MAKGNRTPRGGALNPRFIDITGQRFGMLTALEYRQGDGNGTRSKWLCKCDCGEYTLVESGVLRNLHTRSCGCLREFPMEEREEMGLLPTQGKGANKCMSA